MLRVPHYLTLNMTFWSAALSDTYSPGVLFPHTLAPLGVARIREREREQPGSYHIKVGG